MSVLSQGNKQKKRHREGWEDDETGNIFSNIIKKEDPLGTLSVLLSVARLALLRQ